MKKLLACLLLVSAGTLLAADEKAHFIVKDGKPNAQIVIAKEKRPRMATLAALELQYNIQKISGARLPIVTTPDAKLPVKIYVGKSAGTEKPGVTDKGLKYGAFRMVSGPNWLVLLGNDYDFMPPFKPWPMSRKDSEKPLAAWKKATKGKTDSAWGFPFGAGFKSYWNPKNFDNILTACYGKDSAALWKTGGNSTNGFWNHDEGGSLNAVCEFLRSLGVHWYMPGETGEIIPKMASIPLPKVNETVKPDYTVRAWGWYNYSGFSFDDVLWALRLGMNSGYQKLGPVKGPHGLVHVHSAEAMQKAHPEYYALLSGKRDTEHRGRGTPCFTSKGLMKETENYIRFLFDECKLPSVDIWPVDGLRCCQCKGCKGKSASELVWGFANSVATEVYKTHPDRIITCGAYTSYIDAPDTIKKFSPNLAVWIANSGRPIMDDPEHWAAYWKRVEKWRGKMAPERILRLENNRYHIWGLNDAIPFPVIHPHAVAKDLKALKGISMGDSGEMSQSKGKWKAPGLEHVTIYVQSRFLWKADQDIDKLLDQYFTLFYGPAAGQMKEAITFAEQNYARKDTSRGRGKGDPRNVPLDVNLRFREMLDKAKQTAGDTIYGKRIQMIISELKPKEEIIAENKENEKELNKKRTKAPLALGVNGANLAKAKEYKLDKNRRNYDDVTGKTTFRMGWDKNNLIFDILCKEPDMQNLAVSKDIYDGDHVILMLETPNHSYYHIAVNPNGVISEGNPNPRWKSLAAVKTRREADSWGVRLSVPVVGQEEAQSDPNHRINGSKPGPDAPWFFNIGRKRMRKGKTEWQTFSPTGIDTLHVPERFGKLEIRSAT